MPQLAVPSFTRHTPTQTVDAVALCAVLLKQPSVSWSTVVSRLVRHEGAKEPVVAEALLSRVVPDLIAGGPEEAVQVGEITKALLLEYVARRISAGGSVEGLLSWHRRLERCCVELVPVFQKHQVPLWRVVYSLKGVDALAEPWDKLAMLLHLPEPVLRAMFALDSVQPEKEAARQAISALAVPGALACFEARSLAEDLVSNAPTFRITPGAKPALRTLLAAA